jgi:hypothetical protein
MKSWKMEARQGPNEKLSLLGGYKFEPWKELDSAEKARANQELKKYTDEIAKKNPGISMLAQENRNNQLMKARYQHYQVYTGIIAEFPILQFLRGPDVDRLQLEVALYNMSNKLVEETQAVERMERALNDPRGIQSEAMGLLRYNSLVEEELLNDNRDCGLAASLVYNLNNTELAKSISLGLPILGAAMFAPPVAGFLLGVTAGVGFTYGSLADLHAMESKVLGHIYGDALHTDQAALEKANDNFKFSAGTLPIGMGVGNLVVGTVVKRVIVPIIKGL